MASQCENRIREWMLATVSNGGIERYDDLHVDHIGGEPVESAPQVSTSLRQEDQQTKPTAASQNGIIFYMAEEVTMEKCFFLTSPFIELTRTWPSTHFSAG